MVFAGIFIPAWIFLCYIATEKVDIGTCSNEFENEVNITKMVGLLQPNPCLDICDEKIE